MDCADNHIIMVGSPNVYLEATLTTSLRLEISVRTYHIEQGQSISTTIHEASQAAGYANIEVAYDIVLESVLYQVGYFLQHYNSYRAKVYLRRAINAMYNGHAPPKTYNFATMGAFVEKLPQFKKFLPLRDPIQDIWESRTALDWVDFWEWDPETPGEMLLH